MTELIKTKPGDVFGRLTIRRIYKRAIGTNSGRYITVVDAVCSCGAFAWNKILNDIKRGKTSSCGCIRSTQTPINRAEYLTQRRQRP